MPKPSNGRGELILGAMVALAILGGTIGYTVWQERKEAERDARVEELLRLSRERPVIDLRSTAPSLEEEKEAWREYQRAKRAAELEQGTEPPPL